MKYPDVTTVYRVIEDSKSTAAGINGKWVPARGRGYPAFRHRCYATWLVFTGKADALIWPEGQ